MTTLKLDTAAKYPKCTSLIRLGDLERSLLDLKATVFPSKPSCHAVLTHESLRIDGLSAMCVHPGEMYCSSALLKCASSCTQLNG